MALTEAEVQRVIRQLLSRRPNATVSDARAALRQAEARAALRADGIVQRRVARSTGTVVEVCRSDDLEEDPEAGAWATVCIDHGGVMFYHTRADACYWAPRPEEWCPGCQGDELP